MVERQRGAGSLVGGGLGDDDGPAGGVGDELGFEGMGVSRLWPKAATPPGGRGSPGDVRGLDGTEHGMASRSMGSRAPSDTSRAVGSTKRAASAASWLGVPEATESSHRAGPLVRGVASGRSAVPILVTARVAQREVS